MSKTAHRPPVEAVILNGAAIDMIDQVLDHNAQRSREGRLPIVVQLVGQIEEQMAANASVVVTPALMTDIDQELVRVRHALVTERPGGEAR